MLSYNALREWAVACLRSELQEMVLRVGLSTTLYICHVSFVEKGGIYSELFVGSVILSYPTIRYWVVEKWVRFAFFHFVVVELAMIQNWDCVWPCRFVVSFCFSIMK